MFNLESLPGMIKPNFAQWTIHNTCQLGWNHQSNLFFPYLSKPMFPYVSQFSVIRVGRSTPKPPIPCRDGPSFVVGTALRAVSSTAVDSPSEMPRGEGVEWTKHDVRLGSWRSGKIWENGVAHGKWQLGATPYDCLVVYIQVDWVFYPQ